MIARQQFVVLQFDSKFFFSSRRRHTRYIGDWSSDVCSSDLEGRRMQREIDCLVTGATGFLGRAVVNGLLANGASVRCLIRPGYNLLPEQSLATLLAQSANSHMVQGNLLSPEHTAQAVDGVRVVYHLAAETRGLPATVFAGTVVGSKNLLKAILRARPQRVVLISSLNVYGLANASPRNIVTEDAALDTHPERRD